MTCDLWLMIEESWFCVIKALLRTHHSWPRGWMIWRALGVCRTRCYRSRLACDTYTQLLDLHLLNWLFVQSDLVNSTLFRCQSFTFHGTIQPSCTSIWNGGMNFISIRLFGCVLLAHNALVVTEKGNTSFWQNFKALNTNHDLVPKMNITFEEELDHGAYR